MPSEISSLFFGQPDAAAPPAPFVRFAGSANELRESVEFEGSARTYTQIEGRLFDSYAAGGLVLRGTLYGAATSGTIRLSAGFRNVGPSESVTSAHTYSDQIVNVTAPIAIGTAVEWQIEFDNGAEIDSIVAGDDFVIMLSRINTGVAGNMVGSAYVPISSISLLAP